MFEFDWWEVLPRGSPILVLNSCFDVMPVEKRLREFSVLEQSNPPISSLARGASQNDQRFTLWIVAPQRNDDDDDGTFSQGGW